MKLFATPLSHYSRKVRLLLDHYGEEYTVIDVGNVADSDTSKFDNNPLMSVPVLQDNDVWMIDSDNIASYLVQKIDANDKYNVLTNDPAVLKEPVIKSIIPLLELTGVNARRNSKAMAVVLGERFNKAVTPVSSSPTGLSSGSALCVIFSGHD